MKGFVKTCLFGGLLCLWPLTVLAASAATADHGALRVAALARATLHIPTMTCSNRSCATTVYLSLIHLPGVTAVQIHDETQNVVVTYVPAKEDPAKLLSAVKHAGYPGVLVPGS